MSEEKLVPRLRFEEFENDEEWEQKRLEESVSITMGQSPSSKNYTNNPSDYILVQGNSDLKNGRVFPRIWTTQVTKKANKGDLILSVRAPVGDIGKTDFEVVLGRGVAAIEGNEFIFQLLLKMKVSNYWSNLITGSTFESINSNDIREAKVFFPKIEEQEKIGQFFKKLDKMVRLQQSKVNKVKDLKSAYLSEMFPKEGEQYPKKRFEGLKNNWNPATFSNFLKTESFKKYLANEDRNGIFPIIQQGDSPIEGYGDGIPYKNYDSVVLFGDHTLSLYKPESSFLIASDGIKILSNSKMYRDYLYYLLQRYMPESEGYKRHYSILKNKVVNITENREEQIKIGNFFKNLDNQISNEEEKLAKLEKLKQAYLNDMFV